MSPFDHNHSPHTETKKAVIYCRVSTTKQTKQGHGLESQETLCRTYAATHGYTVEGVFPDDFTGGGDYMARPGMVALLAYLDARPDENFVVIFDDLKRFARDTEFHLNLRRNLSARGASVESPNYKFDESAEGRFVETIFAAQGQLEREQNARQVLQKMKARVQAGYYCRSKPIGYRYEKIEGHGKMLVPDEPNAAIVREAFEGYASGRFETVADVARFLKSNPTVSQATTRQRATKILRRALYAGYITIPAWDFHMHPGQHEPLISLSLWQSVQDKLDGKKKRPARADVHIDFPLRNFVACEGCGSAMTAAWSRSSTGKRYGYYVCQQQHCEWRGKSIRKETIHGEFTKLVRSFSPAPALMNAAKAMLTDLWNGRLSRAERQKEEWASKLAGLDQKQSTLMKRLVATTNDDVAKAYETEIANLTHDKRLLQERAVKALEPQKPFADCFRLVMQFLSKPWVLWENGDFGQQRLLLKLALPEPIPFSRENGFSNPNFSLPFKMLGDKNMQNEHMVPRRGRK